MTNKEQIQEVLEKEGLTIGIYHDLVESIKGKWLKEVLENSPNETDTDVLINRKPHVVEIDTVDGEVDLRVITKEEYIRRYGDERYEMED